MTICIMGFIHFVFLFPRSASTNIFMVTYNTANMENLAARHFLPESKWPKAFQIYILMRF